MKKNILILISGFLMLTFLNGCPFGPCMCADPYIRIYSPIELSGLQQYDKVKIELSEVSNLGLRIEVLDMSGLSGKIINHNYEEYEKYFGNTSLYQANYQKVYSLTKARTYSNYVDYRHLSFNIHPIFHIKAKKSVIITLDFTRVDFTRVKDEHKDRFLFFIFLADKESLGSTFSYRLKVDTDGLKVNKNLFDKKIVFTPEGYWTGIYIDIANKKVDIKY